MNNLFMKANVNPAFKMAQPLPTLPGLPAPAGGKAQPPGCAGRLIFQAATKPRADLVQILVSATLLRGTAQAENAPGLSPAWAGRPL